MSKMWTKIPSRWLLQLLPPTVTGARNKHTISHRLSLLPPIPTHNFVATQRPIGEAMKLLVALLVSTLLVHSLLGTASSSPAPALADGRRGKETVTLGYSNETVYDISVGKCAGCGVLGAWAESLEFLYYHNLVRLARWELPLAWSPRLESYARWWAAQRRADCALRHSFPEGQFALGENIFWGGAGGAWRPGDAVKDWAAEGVDYSYAANACAAGRECGHYTQIVWRGTTSVGCARVACDDGGVFMTCNYYPPGNVVGERPY